MLNPNDIVYQARDKNNENLQWIQRETELRLALGTGEPRSKRPRELTLGRVIEIAKSIALLLGPGTSQKANR